MRICPSRNDSLRCINRQHALCCQVVDTAALLQRAPLCSSGARPSWPLPPGKQPHRRPFDAPAAKQHDVIRHPAEECTPPPCSPMLAVDAVDAVLVTGSCYWCPAEQAQARCWADHQNGVHQKNCVYTHTWSVMSQLTGSWLPVMMMHTVSSSEYPSKLLAASSSCTFAASTCSRIGGQCNSVVQAAAHAACHESAAAGGRHPAAMRSCNDSVKWHTAAMHVTTYGIIHSVPDTGQEGNAFFASLR